MRTGKKSLIRSRVTAMQSTSPNAQHNDSTPRPCAASSPPDPCLCFGSAAANMSANIVENEDHSLVAESDDRVAEHTSKAGRGTSDAVDRAGSKERKNKRGVIYLSYIPDGLNPRNVRVLLSRFGEIDRIFFEPAKMRNGVPISYREGWIEFLKKRVAKQVASLLNGSVISCPKKAAYCGSVWAIKYLHRVKWQHLSEQVNLEKVARDQRLRLEMGQVKKESDFFAEQMHQLKKRQKSGTETAEDVLDKRKQFYEEKQNRGDDCDPAASSSTVNEDLLLRIFS